MKTIDLNADVGEGFGAWSMGRDADIFASVSSANIACGFHAGDPVVMDRAVSEAAAAGVAVGAHPGYPDLAGFGRRSMALGEAEVYCAVLYQIGALRAIAGARGLELGHAKPHGALYNDAAADAAKARAVARAVKDSGGLYLVGPPASRLEVAAAELGLRYAGEFFADRAYRDDGSLVPRSEPGAVIRDREAMIARTLGAVERGVVEAASGAELSIRFATVCLHGDSPEAADFARALRAALAGRGITVAALAQARR